MLILDVYVDFLLSLRKIHVQVYIPIVFIFGIVIIMMPIVNLLNLYLLHSRFSLELFKWHNFTKFMYIVLVQLCM